VDESDGEAENIVWIRAMVWLRMCGSVDESDGVDKGCTRYPAAG
jgi:hypothetical protein